jgi:hypothetical protein
MDNIKKRGNREEVQGIVIDISDGTFNCSGNVSNVSIKGLAMSDVPAKFIEKACSNNVKRFTAIVTSDDNRVRIVLIPRWATKKDKHSLYADAGFEIATDVTGWQSFVMESTSLIKENDIDSCVWGKDLKYLRL